MFIVIALKRIFGGIGSFFSGLAYAGYIFTWDISLFLLNLVSFKRKVGKVVLQGTPGFGGQWPEYIPPKDTDSRSACPALNALANHGKCFVLFKNHFLVILSVAGVEWKMLKQFFVYAQVSYLGMDATSRTRR